MELDTFIQIGLPVSLALIMLSMGMMLKTADFTRVLEQPRALMVGLTAQLILVPMIAVALLFIFNLPPLLAVGLLVLSFSPGGTTSNLFSYLARGDVALSVALTAIASLITPFTIPLLTELALQMQLGENKEIIVPIGLTMKRLFIVTLLPVLIGMSLRIFKPAVADTIQPYIHKISVVLFLAVISSIIIQQWDKMPDFLNQVGTITSLMIVIAMLLGYYIAKLSGLRNREVKTLSIEVGMQNGGMALLVTQGVLQNPTMSIVPVIYGLIMLIPVILFVLGAYLAMSGHFSAQVLLHSIPISILISLLLLSNELRDWESDKSKDVGTLTVRIGYQNAVRLYWFLIVLISSWLGNVL
ncbi:putative sodium-dependent transporter YocS [Nymphon striatum]|nr:putative sodium-dependent transporter YocS [Nymphon striatum]